MRYLLLNRILKISMFLLFTFVLFYFIFTCNYKDKFSVGEIKINFTRSNERIGILIQLNKKYVSSPNSKRIFFCGSREKGLFGIDDKNFNLLIKDEEDKDITKYFKDDLNSLNQENSKSLEEFIHDLKENKRYLSGQRLSDKDLIFWLDENYVINKSKLYISVDKYKRNYIIEPSSAKSFR